MKKLTFNVIKFIIIILFSHFGLVKYLVNKWYCYQNIIVWIFLLIPLFVGYEVMFSILVKNLAKLIKTVNATNISDEISYYAKKKHAEIIYRKCIKYKKYELAKKITDNYRL